jgi:hypothetical protein
VYSAMGSKIYVSGNERAVHRGHTPGAELTLPWQRMPSVQSDCAAKSLFISRT